MNDVVIIGAGGLAREVAFLIEEINRIDAVWRILGFVNRNEGSIGEKIGKYPIFCDEEDLLTLSVNVVIAIGDPIRRKIVAEKLKVANNLVFPNIIHPSTIRDKDSMTLGPGNVICAGNIFTSNISIGAFNYFNLNCTYGHDVEVGDYCVFNPGSNVSGGVKIGTGCLVGTGSTILQYLNIEDGSSVVAGSIVVKDVAFGSVVAGFPAKRIK